MKETTATEWLENEVSNLVVVTKEYVLILINQAKEVERREKAEEYLKGFRDGKEWQRKNEQLTFKSE
jgi:hypothetical protein